MQNIRPSAELRNKYNEISNLCRETREPVFITVNGHGDTVIMNLEEYNQMVSELELLRMLAESQDDVNNGRVRSFSESLDELRKKLQ